ncbi:MAG: DNA polymerase III subunit chi [Alphaproteobacteria bacterium]|nr:DNA polymerase III subunit chi [Alphaproteobacteria bacterium]
MTQISFYHLTATALDQALPKLLEKAYGSGLRAHVWCESEARMEQLNTLLWTYDPASFLPHGSEKEPHPELQPVLLGTEENAANQAPALFITHGQTVVNPTSFDRVFDLFDGKDSAATDAARARWKHYKDQGLTLSYFKQTPAGGWEKAA